MKKNCKIIIIMLLALMLLFATFTACKKPDDVDPGDGDENNGVIDVTEEPEEPEITLSSSSVSLTLGETYVLTVSYVNTQKDENKALTFSSADTAIVRVDNDGNVEAYGKGSAKVTATYDNLTATCDFTVDDNGILPSLEFEGGAQNSYRMINGSSFELLPYIAFNTDVFADGTFIYDIKNEDILEISSDGVVLAKKKGETEVEVTAQWRGYTGDTLKKTFSFAVENDVRFAINGQGYAPDIELYTVDISPNKTMATESVFEYSVTLNGAPVDNKDINFIIAEYSVATYSNGKICATGFGKTKGNLSYTFDGEKYETEFDITVERPVFRVNKPINHFSAVKGMHLDSLDSWKTSKLFDLVKHGLEPDDSEGFVDAEQDGNDLTLENGKILGVKGELHRVADVEITAGSDKILYQITLKVYGDIIAAVEDLNVFNRGKHNTPLTGYFILVNDITDEYNAVSPKSIADAGLDHWGMKEKNYFKGTFDGQGYSITNYIDTSNINSSIGLFGEIAKGSVIKNFSLRASQASAGRLLAIAVGDNVTVENVYLEVVQSVAVPPLGAIARTVGTNLKLNNVVVNMPTTAAWTQVEADKLCSDPNRSTGPCGLLFGGNGANWKSKETITNVYVYGNFPIAIGYAGQGYGYAANETDTVWPYMFLDKGAAYQFDGVKRYDSALGMAADAANNDLSSFDNGYWGVENGRPVWNSARNDYSIIAGGTTVANGSSFDAEVGTDYAVSLKQFSEVVEFTLESSDPAAVVIDGKNFKLIDINKSATVTVKVGTSDVGSFTVGKAREAVTVTGDTDFSIFHGKVISTDNSTWFGESEYEILEASLNGTSLTVEAGKITSGISSVWKRENKTIGTGTVSSGAPANVAKLNGDLVIKTAEKIVTFKSVFAYDGVIINGEQFKEIFDIDKANKVSGGFYVLGANIDMTGIELAHEAMSNPESWQHFNTFSDTSGFQGVFEGRGYTISNFTAKAGGLFGTFCYTSANYSFDNVDGHGDMYDQLAVVRNVAVVNADVSEGPVFAKGVGTYQAHLLNAGRLAYIENVYVSYSAGSTALRGLILHYRSAIGMKNVIVDASAVNATVKSDAVALKPGDSRNEESLLIGNGTLFGSVGYIDRMFEGKTGSNGYAAKCFENVYVVSSDALMLGKSAGSDGTYGYFCMAYAMNKAPEDLASYANDTVEDIKTDLGKGDGSQAYIFRPIYQYTTAAEMLSDTTNFKDNVFTSEYWTIDGTDSISWKGRT